MMENIFLVKAYVTITYYMSDRKSQEENFHLVKAENEQDAKYKVEDHYERKSVDYSYTYLCDAYTQENIGF